MAASVPGPLARAQGLAGSSSQTLHSQKLFRLRPGDKHPAWMLSFTQRGRRRCLYVPLALVPVIRQAHKNGRRLEDLLYQVGPALLKEFRRQRP